MNDANGQQRNKIYPLQVGYKKYGQSGIEVSDWFPHIGSKIDDIAVIRSMWTTDDNHGAQVQFHSGRHMLDPRVADDRRLGELRFGHAQRKPTAVYQHGAALFRQGRRSLSRASLRRGRI